MLVEVGDDHDLLVVEGQGSIIHPAYSAVTCGILHGSMADGLVLCHAAGREAVHGYESFSLPPLADYVDLYEGSRRPSTRRVSSPARSTPKTSTTTRPPRRQSPTSATRPASQPPTRSGTAPAGSWTGSSRRGSVRGPRPPMEGSPTNDPRNGVRAGLASLGEPVHDLQGHPDGRRERDREDRGRGRNDRRRRRGSLGSLRRDRGHRRGRAPGSARRRRARRRPHALHEIEAELAAVVNGNPAARAAVSIAVHDLAAKRLGVPSTVSGGSTPRPRPRPPTRSDSTRRSASVRRPRPRSMPATRSSRSSSGPTETAS